MRSRFYTVPAQPNLLQPFSIPPPMSGIDATLPFNNMPATVAVYLYNMVPRGRGAVVREGYRLWAEDLSGGEVRTLMPFHASGDVRTDDRLFAATRNGIFDVTTRGVSNPPAEVTFSAQDDVSGYMQYVHHTDANGLTTLLVAGARNGLYEYDPNSGTPWFKYTTGEITGLNPAAISFLASHKGRLWFLENDSSDAWYMPLNAKQGAATRFSMSSKLHHGGPLEAIYSWTVDGGAGVDDLLVFVSRAGDVVVYQGTDPAQSSTWNLRGSWYIGEVPAGRRIGNVSGGDIILLSIYGLTSLKSLVSGLDPTRIERNVAGKIAPLLSPMVTERVNRRQWQISIVAEEGVLVIVTPTETNERPIQYVLNLNRLADGSGGGWSFWRDIPATCFDAYAGDAFFGTAEGKVYQMDGTLDDLSMTDTGGKPVEFSYLGPFTDLGAPAQFKQVTYIRPTFASENIIDFEARAIYDFNFPETDTGPSLSIPFLAAWDVAIWDDALWSGLSAYNRIFGGGGYGRHVAIAVRGSTVARTILLNIDGEWKPWGRK